LDLIDQGLRQAKAIPHDLDETFATKPSLFPVLSLGLSVDTLGYFRAAGAPIQTLAELQAYNLAQPETRIPRGQNIVDLAVQVMTSLTTESGLAEPALAPLYEQAALDLRQTSAALLAQTFADHQVALLISLSNTHSTLYATAGYPAITIPLGLDSNGTPNGVTFIGKPGQDAQLLGYAYAFEQATRLRSPPPPPKL
jgi:amidase